MGAGACLEKAGHPLAVTRSPSECGASERERARSEIMGCKKRLEEEIREPIDHFSYPHPALNRSGRSKRWSLRERRDSSPRH